MTCIVSALSVDHLVRKSLWKRVEQQDEEQHHDEQDQGEDDVLLVAPPHQVKETLEWVDKPREGGVRTAGEERSKEFSTISRRNEETHGERAQEK